MRLKDNTLAAGRIWPKGCLPPSHVASQIGDHAWEEGDPTAASPVPDEEHDEQAPDTSAATAQGAAEVSPVILEDDEPEPQDDEAVTPPLPDEPSSFASGGIAGADPKDPGLPDPLPPEPKRIGRGASREAWAAYAAQLNIGVTGNQNRDAIIAIVDAVLSQRTAD